MNDITLFLYEAGCERKKRIKIIIIIALITPTGQIVVRFKETN